MDSATLLTPRDVATRLNVPLYTLARWRRTGHGPAFLRLSSRVVRYEAEAVDGFLAARRWQLANGLYAA